MKLRSYQQKIVDTTIANESSSKIAITLPTGGGKSIIISELVKHYNKEGLTCVVMVNRKSLIGQLRANLKALKLPVRVISAGEHEGPTTANVVLTMEQSFNPTHAISCDVLLRDEIHDGFHGARYNGILEYLAPTKVIGLTATPIDDKGVYLFDNSWLTIEETSTSDLIKSKFLVAPDYVIPKKSELMDYSNITTTGGDYNLKQIGAKLNTPEHNSFTAEMIVKHQEGRKTIVFTTTIAHAEGVYNALLDRNVSVGIAHSKLDNNDIDQYKAGAITTLVSVSKLTTGFDDPNTTMVVLVRPTKIERLYVQMVGRGLRIAEGKTECRVLDLSRCLSSHGFVDTPQLFSTRDLSKETNYATDCIADMVSQDEHITKEKVLEYNLDMRQKRIDELLMKVELQSIEIGQLKTIIATTVSKESITTYAIDDVEEVFNSTKNIYELLGAADKAIGMLELTVSNNGIETPIKRLTEKTKEKIATDFYSVKSVDNDTKIDKMRARLLQVIDGKAHFFADGNYSGFHAITTYLSWMYGK